MNDGAGKDNNCVLEVIACSVEDAVNAEIGGADRIELIRDFGRGGLTPPVELVRAVQRSVGIPIRVMLREEVNFELTEPASIEKMRRVAGELNAMRIDGIVLGFLANGHVDAELTRAILDAAPDLRATFHHAFEDTSDKAAAIGELRQISQIDRILSHGGFGEMSERAAELAKCAVAAAPDILMLAGGRIDLAMICELKKRTPIREFHVGSAARDGGKVSVSKVRALSNAVKKS